MPFPPFDTLEFRVDYRERYGDGEYDYNFYEPAYRYGYDLAVNNRDDNKDWTSFEDEARFEWERSDEEGAWEDVKDAVRHAWETVAKLLHQI
jgi:hypothetical protein